MRDATKLPAVWEQEKIDHLLNDAVAGPCWAVSSTSMVDARNGVGRRWNVNTS